MHGGPPATLGSAVHYIVVQQGSVVHQFGRRRKADGILRDAPGGTGHQQRQHGPQQLAGPLLQRRVGLLQQRDVAAERIGNQGAHALQCR